MKHVVAKTLVLLTMVLAITTVCWSTIGTSSAGTTIVVPDDDPNLPPEASFFAGSLIRLDDEPTDPNDPNIPEKI